MPSVAVTPKKSDVNKSRCQMFDDSFLTSATYTFHSVNVLTSHKSFYHFISLLFRDCKNCDENDVTDAFSVMFQSHFCHVVDK